MDIFQKTFTVLGGIVVLALPYLIYKTVQNENMLHEKYDYKIYILGEDSKDRVFVKRDAFEIVDGVLYFKCPCKYCNA